ncbi:unnamed protein product, partial [Polarella glacialis]
MRRAVGSTPAESTLAVSMEITHRSRTVLSACGHFLQVQFLRELDPSCRAATDSVSPVQSGMPLAQFLGLHAPCGAIQEAEKRSSLAHLQMPCSDRRHIATKTGQQKMCGACWCFPRRVVLYFGPSATPVRRELSSHCAGSCASLGLVSARPHLKPLLLPIGASRIQQPTDKKMRAAFCKLTSKLSASSLEDLGLMELPSAHKKDMSVVRCGSFLPAAVDASSEGLAKSSRGRAFQQPSRLPCLRLRCLKLAAQPQQEHQQCKLDCKPQLQLARRAGSLLPTRNCPTFQLDNSVRVPCGRAHGLRLVCVVSSRGQLQGASLCALSASWDLQTLVRCEKRDSILQSSLVRTCQNFVTSLPAASSNSSVLACSNLQRSGHQSAAAECLLRCVTVEQDTALTVAGTVHLGSGSTKLHAAFCNLDAATRGPMQAVTALGQSLDFWPLRASGANRMAKMLVHCATLHSSTVIAATSTCAMQAEGGGNCQQKECNRSPRSACALAPTSYLPSFPASFLREALKCQDNNLQAISEPRCQVIRRVRSTPSSVMRELPCYLAPRPRATFSSVLECDDDSALTTSELWRSKVPARADEQKTGVALCTMSAACSQIPLGRLTLPRPPEPPADLAQRSSSGAEMLPVCGVPCWGFACQQLASKNTWQCISIVMAPALQHGWLATCRDVSLDFLCGAAPKKPVLPLVFFSTSHPVRAGQAADISERRLALTCRPWQQAGQSQPLRRQSPLGQVCAGEEDRHRGIVVSSASLLFQAPAIAGTSEASASWHKLAQQQQQQRNQFAQAGTSWHSRLCGLKLAGLQQTQQQQLAVCRAAAAAGRFVAGRAASHSAWDAGSRLSSGKPQLGWVVAIGFRREGTAASCGPATFLPVSRLQKHQRPLCWRTPVLLRSRPAAALPKKQTPAMTGITCGADYSDLNLPLMQAACGDDTPCMSSPTLLLPQRGQAPQQPDFQLLIQRPQLLSFAAHWQSGLHVTTKSDATCQGSARHARAEERSVLPSCCMLSLVDRVLATTPHSKVHHRATYSWNIELHMRSSCSGQQQQTPLGAEPSAILPCICIPKQAARSLAAPSFIHLHSCLGQAAVMTRSPIDLLQFGCVSSFVRATPVLHPARIAPLSHGGLVAPCESDAPTSCSPCRVLTSLNLNGMVASSHLQECPRRAFACERGIQCTRSVEDCFWLSGLARHPSASSYVQIVETAPGSHSLRGLRLLEHGCSSLQ